MHGSAAGIWSRTLNAKTGLPRATVEKALKVLEGRKTIKRVKSVKVRCPSCDDGVGVCPASPG